MLTHELKSFCSNSEHLNTWAQKKSRKCSTKFSRKFLENENRKKCTKMEQDLELPHTMYSRPKTNLFVNTTKNSIMVRT